MKNSTGMAGSKRTGLFSWMRTVAAALTLALCTAGSGQAATYDVCIYDESGGTCTSFGTDLCSAAYNFNPGPRSQTFTLSGVSSINNIQFKLYWTCDPGNFEFRLNGNVIGTSSFSSFACTCTPGAFGSYPQTVTIPGAAATPFWNFSGSNTLEVIQTAVGSSAVAGYSATIDYVASGGGGGTGSTPLCIFDAGGGACGAFGGDLCSASYTCGPFSSSQSITIPTATSITSIVYSLYWTCDPGSFTFRLNGNVIGSSSFSSFACTCTPSAFGSYPQTVTISGAAADPFWVDGGVNTLTVDHTGGACVAGYSAVINWSGTSGGGGGTSGPCLSQNWSAGLSGWSSASLVGGVNSWTISSTAGDGSALGSLAAGAPNNGSTFGYEHSAMTSPAFSVTAGATLNFRTWQCNEYSFFDREHVEISTDGGATWNVLINYTDALWGSTSTWTNASVTIPFTSSNARIRFRYDTWDGCCGCTGGWFVDDIAVTGAGCGAVTCTMYAITGSSGTASTLLKLDPATGAVTSVVGPTGFSHITGLAVHPTTGAMYGHVNEYFGFGNGALVSINPSTGAATLIGATGMQSPDMTFSSSGTLYAWNEYSATTGTYDNLWTVNTTTGAGTPVGPVGAGTARTGLGWNSTTNKLYMKSFSTIHELNPATGALLTSVGMSVGTTNNMLAYNPSNSTFYTGTRNSATLFTLHTINPLTGVVTNVGTNSQGRISALAFGCSGGSSVTCSVNAGADVTICAGSSTTLNAVGTSSAGSGGTYSWSPATGLSSTTVANPVATPSVTTTYTVTYTISGCTSTDNVVVTVNPLPNASFSGLTSPTCTTSPVQTLVPAVAGGTFSGPGVSGSTFNPAVAGPGTWTITYTRTVAGCTNSTSQTVTVNAPPNASFSGLSSPACTADGPQTLVPVTAGGTFSGPGVSGSTFNPATAGPGTWTITYTVSSGGCTSSTSQTVNVIAPPNAAFTAPAFACSNDAPITLVPGTPGGVFSGPGVSGSTFNPAVAGAGSHVISYTVCASPAATYAYDFSGSAMGWTTGNLATTAAGFSSIASTWAYNAGVGLPAGSMGTPNSGSFGAENSFILSPTLTFTGGPVTVTFSSLTNNESGFPTFYDVEWVEISTNGGATWTAMHGLVPNLHNFFGDNTWRTITVSASVAATTNGRIRFRYDTGDACCGIAGWNVDNVNITSGSPFCCATSNQTIAVSPAPDASFTGLPSMTCADAATVTLNPTTPGGVFSGPGVVGNTFNPALAGPGTHTITYGTCIIGGTSSFDFSTGAQGWTTGNLATTAAGFGSIASTWTWTGAAGLPAGSMGTPNSGSMGAENSFIQSPLLNFAGGALSVTFSSRTNNESGFPTFYDVEWVEYSTNGGATWTAMHGLVPDLHNFFGDNTWRTITVSVAGVPATPNGRIRFRYDTGDACCGIAGWNVDNVNITGVTSGAIVCCASTSQNVTVYPSANPAFTGLPSSICLDGGIVTLTPATPGGTFSGPGVSGNTFNPAVAGVGTFTVTYTITTGPVCTYTSSQTITVNPVPTANAGPDQFVCYGACATLGGSVSTSYSYSFNSGAEGWTTGNLPTTALGLGSIASTWVWNPGVGLPAGAMGTPNSGFSGPENSFIQSPILSLGGTTTVTFSSLTNNESGFPTFYDVEWVEYSTNGGATWTAMHGLVPNLHSFFGDNTWRTITVSAVIPATSNGRIRFRYDTGDGCCGIAGWHVDNVVIGGAAPGPVTYSWSPAAGLSCTTCANPVACPTSTTTYTLTVTNSFGCDATDDVTVTVNPEILVSVAPSVFACGYNVSCNGASDGTATANVSGGSGSYSYLWSTGATTATITGLAAGTYSVTITDGAGCTASGSVTLTQPDPLTNTLFSPTYGCGFNISCNGGTDGAIVATTAGGCAPYSYLWSTGGTDPYALDLAAGTYSVTITDANGCTTSSTITLTQPDPLVSSGVMSVYSCGFNVSCNGATDGSVNLSVTGGCAPYSFSWSNGATTEDLSGIGAGTYTVNVTDVNGCTTSSTFTLTQPDPLTGTIDKSLYSCGFNISCYGASDGSVDAIIAGGCAPYSYSWVNISTGPVGSTQVVSGLPAGTYVVTVTDANGCTLVLTAELTEPAPLVSSGVVSTFACGYNVSCFGACDGSINLSVTGGAECLAYTYAWSNGATTEDVSGLCAGTYSVTITDDNGCFTSSTFTLTQPDQLVITGVTSPTYACGYNISCNGGNDGSITATFDGGADCLDATVTLSGPVSSTVSATGTVTFTGLTAGTYTVTVTDANGCTTSSSITLTEPAPLNVDAGPNATVFYGYPGYDCTTLNGCCGSGGCGPYSYAWSTSSGPVGTGLSVTVCPSVNTVYYLTITDANGCTFTDSVLVCAINVICGSTGGGPKIQICHTPPATDMTMCLPISAIAAHLAHGDYLGPCTSSGAPDPCLWPSGPMKQAEPSAASSENQGLGAEMVAFPNPFSSSTTVEFTLNSAEHATLKVFSLTGVEVSTLFSGEVMSGQRVSAEFSAANLSSGIYFAKLQTQSGAEYNLKLVVTH